MRSFMTALVVVGLLAVPSFGIINISVQSGGMNVISAIPGQTLQIDIVAHATNGLNSLSGDIVASGTNALTSVPESFVWSPEFRNTTVPGMIQYTNGQSGPNGGWTEFGSARTDILTNPIGGWTEPTIVASYYVQVTGIPGHTMLAFIPGEYGGWACAEDDGGTEIGTITPLVVTIPEPATLAMLALGGLLVARRRSR